MWVFPHIISTFLCVVIVFIFKLIVVVMLHIKVLYNLIIDVH